MPRARLIPGLLLIAAGTFLLLDRLDAVDAGAVIRGWWPLAVVGLGASRLLQRPADLLGGAITAGIGLVLLAMTQGLVTSAVLTYLWPLALIGVGLWVMSGRSARPATTSDHHVNAVAVFSGRTLAPTSTRFAGGSLFAAFGGIDVDLRGARPQPAGARLDVTTIFGGCDIVVPPGWRVRMHGPAVFGGYDNQAESQHLPDDAPALEVRVLTLFGGAEVKLGQPAGW